MPSISSVKAFFLPLLHSSAVGVKFSIITSIEAAFEESGEIPKEVDVYRVSSFRKFQPNTFLNIRGEVSRILCAIKPDIVHAHFAISAFLLATIKTPSKRWATLHGVYHLADHSVKGKFIGILERFAIKKLDRVDVLNNSDFEALKHLKGIKQLPLPGVGIDEKKFDPSKFDKKSRNDIRKELGIEHSQKTLLFVGRYTHFKGYTTFLKAAQRYLKDDNLKFLSCGAPDGLHKLSDADYAPENFTDLGWTNRVDRFMAAADLLIFPSLREGLPVTVMQAQAMHLPVLAYQNRGVEDLIEDGKTGFLVENINEQAFFDRLAFLIQNAQVVKDVQIELQEQNYKHSARKYVEYQLQAYIGKP